MMEMEACPQENESLSVEGVRCSLHGAVYQLKLSMLFLQSALDKNYGFELYSEKKDGEKFDDVIFRYNKDEQYRFVQAKHKLNPEKEKITIDQLLSENHPFSVQKYFISFRRIKQKQQYEGKIKDLAICTNARFSDAIENWIKKGWLAKKDGCDEKDGDILDIGGGKRYEFVFDKKNEGLVKKLKDSSDLNRLARELVKVVFDKIKTLNKNNALFKSYHISLVHEVFDKNPYPEGNKWYCEFKKDFILNNNISSKAELLLEAFRKEFALKTGEHIDSNNLWSTVNKKKINASSAFGKHVSDEELTQSSLPNDPVSEDEIKEFLETFTFAVEQPNEEELGKHIQEKIFNSLDHWKDNDQAEMVYNYVQKEMLDWLKKAKSTALLETNNFFSEGAEKVENLIHLILNKQYTCYIKESGINFINKSEELQKLRNFLDSKDKKILNLICSEKNIILNQAKVYQVKEQAAWQLRDILSLRKFEETKSLHLFTKNLLVIVCKNESQDKGDDIERLYNELADSIKDNEKKVVLITQNNSILASFFKERPLINYYEESLDKTRIWDLGLDYIQNKLLKKTVIFQGQERDFAYLVEIENGELSNMEMRKLENVVKHETLSELISDEDLSVGDKLPDFVDPSSPYYDSYHINITRKFGYQMMSKDSFKNCINEIETDIFAFSGIEKDYLKDLVPEKEKIIAFSKECSVEEFVGVRFFMLYNPEKDFQKLSNTGRDVHWFTNKNDKFILKHSSRLSNLRKFIQKEDSRKMTQDLTDSVVIISGDPGVGKSTVLTTSSIELDSLVWVIRVNLKNHQIHLDNANFKDLKEIIEFFSKSTVGLEATLAKSLLRYRLEYQGKIVLFLDGYDEIGDRYQEKVIMLIKTLKDTKGKVWLTTRLNKLHEVENALGIFSYFLEPFDKKQQKEFLMQFWISKLEVKNSCQNKIDIFTEKLLGSLCGKDLMKEGDLVGIVLQARMVAEIFQNECRKYIETKIFNLSKRIDNIFDLYDEFIAYQYERYFTEKIKIGNVSQGVRVVLTKSFAKAHGYLALKTLFSKDKACEELLRDEIYPQDELSGIGLVTLKQLKDTQLDFVHRTYAEYFIAKFLVMMLGKREDDPKYKVTREFFLRNIFLDRNKLIRAFVNHGIPNIKWKAIQDCDLMNDIETKGSLPLLKQNIISEISLSELEEDVRSCMKWKDGKYDYCGIPNTIDKLFLGFMRETDIGKLETTLKFLVNAKNKSRVGCVFNQLANDAFSRNITNALKHFLTQAKLKNRLQEFQSKILWSIMENYEVDHFETFENKLAKLDSSTPENEREKYAEDLTDFLFSLSKEKLDLLQLKQPDIEFPFVADIQKNIENKYSSQYDMRRNFVYKALMATRLRILTYKMSRQFCSILDPPFEPWLDFWEFPYASTILNQLIYPLIDKMKEDKLPYVDKLPCVDKLELIKMLARFTRFSIEQGETLSLEHHQLQTVLELVEALPNKLVAVHAAEFLYTLGKAGLKLIDTGQKLLILDPVSELQYALSNFRDQIVEVINWKCKNPQADFIKAYKEVVYKGPVPKRRASCDESGLGTTNTKKRKGH